MHKFPKGIAKVTVGIVEKELVGFKFVSSALKSRNGECQWAIGEWKHYDGKLAICESGLHASETALESLQYTYGDRWFQVAVKGEIKKDGDKFVCSDMKLVQEIPVSKVLVPFAISCARRCYHNWKKQYPEDKRVYAAILAAEKCFRDPSPENIEASGAACAAEGAACAAWGAACAAESAAESAACAAWGAECAAESAAESAAWGAACAAESAECAAESAACAAACAAWGAAGAAWGAACAAESAEKKWQQQLLYKLIRKALKDEIVAEKNQAKEGLRLGD